MARCATTQSATTRVGLPLLLQRRTRETPHRYSHVVHLRTAALFILISVQAVSMQAVTPPSPPPLAVDLTVAFAQIYEASGGPGWLDNSGCHSVIRASAWAAL